MRRESPEVSDNIEKKIEATVDALVAELKKQGVTHDKPSKGAFHWYFRMFENEYIPVEVRAELPTNRYRSTPSGKVRIQVGSYGNKTQFPERKAGFDYEAIVQVIVRHVQGIREEQKRRKAKDSAREKLNDSVARVNEAVGDIPGVRCSVDESLRGINIVIGRLTEEKALAVMQALKEIL